MKKNYSLAAILAASTLLSAQFASAAVITWNGGTSAWDINTTANWTGGSTFYNNGDTVTFADTGVTAVTITAGGVAPASTAFATNAQNYTFSGGAITAGTLTVNGGTQTLNNGANTYTGATTVNTSAALALAGTSTIAGSLVTLNRGTLSITGNSVNTRLNDGAFTSNGGTLNLSNGLSGTLDETIGALSFSGNSRLSTTRAGGGTGDLAILRIASLNRVDRGILEIGRFGAASRSATTVTGTAPTVTNGMVSPYYIFFNNDAQPTFATYSAQSVPGVASNFSGASVNTSLNTVLTTSGNLGSATAVYALAASASTLAVNGAETKNAYAARFQRTLTGGASTTLAVHSGGIIIDQNTSVAAPGNVSLGLLNISFPTGVEGVIYAGRTASQTHTINGTISGDNGLTKSGPATLVLTGTNAYTGLTTVNLGVLSINGSIADSDAFIADGATLNGSGTLNYNLLGDVADLITVNGTLDISTLNFNLVQSGTQTQAEYIIADYTAGTLTGANFASVIAPGFTIDYDGTLLNPGNYIVLVNNDAPVIPEPASLSLLALGTLALATPRRRR